MKKVLSVIISFVVTLAAIAVLCYPLNLGVIEKNEVLIKFGATPIVVLLAAMFSYREYNKNKKSKLGLLPAILPLLGFVIGSLVFFVLTSINLKEDVIGFKTSDAWLLSFGMFASTAVACCALFVSLHHGVGKYRQNPKKLTAFVIVGVIVVGIYAVLCTTFFTKSVKYEAIANSEVYYNTQTLLALLVVMYILVFAGVRVSYSKVLDNNEKDDSQTKKEAKATVDVLFAMYEYAKTELKKYGYEVFEDAPKNDLFVEPVIEEEPTTKEDEDVSEDYDLDTVEKEIDAVLAKGDEPLVSEHQEETPEEVAEPEVEEITLEETPEEEAEPVVEEIIAEETPEEVTEPVVEEITEEEPKEETPEEVAAAPILEPVVVEEKETPKKPVRKATTAKKSAKKTPGKTSKKPKAAPAKKVKTEEEKLAEKEKAKELAKKAREKEIAKKKLEAERAKEKERLAKEKEKAKEKERLAKEKEKAKEKERLAKEKEKAKEKERLAKEKEKAKEKERIAKEKEKEKAKELAKKAREKEMAKKKLEAEKAKEKEKADNEVAKQLAEIIEEKPVVKEEVVEPVVNEDPESEALRLARAAAEAAEKAANAAAIAQALAVNALNVAKHKDEDE